MCCLLVQSVHHCTGCGSGNEEGQRLWNYCYFDTLQNFTCSRKYQAQTHITFAILMSALVQIPARDRGTWA